MGFGMLAAEQKKEFKRFLAISMVLARPLKFLSCFHMI